MTTSQPQVHSRFRPYIATMEEGIAKETNIMLQETTKTDVQRVQHETLTGLQGAAARFREPLYHPMNDPDLSGFPPNARRFEQEKMNGPARAVSRAIKYCQEHPGCTGADLNRLRKTSLITWPGHLSIESLPLIVEIGETFVELLAVQRHLRDDGDEA